jgi:hypothetical protein
VLLTCAGMCALCAAMQYRTSHNYKSGEFLGSRIGDKVLMGL